jgi:hypothetical protein
LAAREMRNGLREAPTHETCGPAMKHRLAPPDPAAWGAAICAGC